MPIEKETQDKVIAEIKKTNGEEKLKTIALYKIINEVYCADDHFSTSSCKNAYNNHCKQKDLFNRALSIYKGETKFNKNCAKDLADFFSSEELSSSDFEQCEVLAAKDVWLVLFERIETLNSLITVEDKEILRFLIHVDVCKTESSNDYTVEFTFAKNDFFKNEKLKVEVCTDDGDDSGESIKEIKSTEIEWETGKDVRNTEVTTKAKTKKGKKIPAKTKLEKKESFFWLFRNHKRPEEEELEEDEEEEPDEFSDTNLFFQAADILTIFEKDMYEFAIPAMFGLEVDAFKFAADFGGDQADIQGMLGPKDGKDAKPECKQQ